MSSGSQMHPLLYYFTPLRLVVSVLRQSKRSQRKLQIFSISGSVALKITFLCFHMLAAAHSSHTTLSQQCLKINPEIMSQTSETEDY